jgi:hypothetical protein
MNKRGIIIACSLFALAVCIGVYAAGFTWRQVVFGMLAAFTWQIGEGVWKTTFPPAAFRRMQFRVELDYLELALQRAGLYEAEQAQAASVLSDGIPGKGRITFTWLERELFFVNTTNHYSSRLEFSIDLPSFGTRAPKHGMELSDMLELRGTMEGYELVLLTREQRYCWPETTHGQGLVLLSLPYKFFWAFQGSGEPWECRKNAADILTALPNMEYRSDPEVPKAWDYHNEYVSLHWWAL